MLTITDRQLPIPEGYIERLKQTEQNPRYHAEGSVYNHTLLVLRQFEQYCQQISLSEADREVLYWVSVLHDIAKPEVTRWKNGRWVATGHEKAGVPIARQLLLQQPEISTEQRQRILSLIRWHHVPLRWGLRNAELNDYKLLASRIDMRLLGIFASFDIKGRICEQQEEVLALIGHFNTEIVPNIEFEMGTYQHIQAQFQRASQSHKNALWRSWQMGQANIMEKLLIATSPPDKRRHFSCTFTLGNISLAEWEAIEAAHTDYPNYRIDSLELTIEDAHSRGLQLRQLKHFLSVYGKDQRDLFVHLGFLDSESRLFINEHVRSLGGEIRYHVFENSLTNFSSFTATKEYTDTHEMAYRKWDPPHPWESHQLSWQN
jgi:putative nucleotidyltransferase with HDIG domain